jgi:hypothetical protein
VIGGARTLYAKEPLIDLSAPSADDVTIASLVRTYRGRNITADFTTPYYVWGRAGPTPGDAAVSFPVFNMTAIIRVPISKVRVGHDAKGHFQRVGGLCPLPEGTGSLHL